ncbi:MAG: hypothetical protein HFH36_13490 [Lachnospiraceae bacterium]|uniref:hypothetical protein n=1 Tax=Sporofaciens musculi TaxID=2681861 RepID=UPI00259CB0F5|nr:hypothetical protein [Sporofaciens musculi]MCI9448352.1 hypothetical protein [Lachnospiraceae bacterium]
MDPQQELFTRLLTEIRKKGYDVYDDGLPAEGTPYPFIYLADSQQTDHVIKGAVFGNVYQTIHVWHNNPKKRGTVSAILLDIKGICWNMRKTKNFLWCPMDTSQRLLPDNTTKRPLLHGILDAAFKFY